MKFVLVFWLNLATCYGVDWVVRYFQSKRKPSIQKESVQSIEYGSKVWRNPKGELHRTDGPAVIHSDGYQAYWQNGLLHRTDGPAIIRPDGTQEYFQNGELHREDGPAVILSNGKGSYYLNGYSLTEEEFNSRFVKAIENGTQEHWINGKPCKTSKPKKNYEDLLKSNWINEKKTIEKDFLKKDEKIIYYSLNEKLNFIKNTFAG